MDFSPITILILMVSIFLAIKIAGKLYISHSRDESHKADYPYFKNSFLLTPAEISFKHILKIAVGESYEINTKVRLADLISVHKGLQKSDWSRAFNPIKADLSPKFSTMTLMRFPINYGSWRSQNEKTLQRRTNH